MKQDKGRGVVLMDKAKYVEKVTSLLDTDNFKEQLTDKTKSVEEAVQRILLKNKTAIGEETYTKKSIHQDQTLASSMVPQKCTKSNRKSKIKLESYRCDQSSQTLELQPTRLLNIYATS